MQLLLNRSHRPGLFHRAIYSLEVRAQFSGQELAAIQHHGLLPMLLYSRGELADGGSGVFGLLFRMGFLAANLSFRVGDLIDGKRMESGDILAILSLEDEITAAASKFNQVLIAASNYDGDRVVEL